jgi:uncharacterized membrane protein
MMWNYGPMWEAGWGWHWIPMALWWVIMLLVAAGLARWVFGWGPGGHRRDRALRFARERYAKGEISKKEFERLKADLAS